MGELVSLGSAQSSAGRRSFKSWKGNATNLLAKLDIAVPNMTFGTLKPHIQLKLILLRRSASSADPKFLSETL